MKQLMLAAGLIFTSVAARAFDAPYFDFIDPKSPSTSLGALFSMKGEGLGATKFVNTYAVVFHRASKTNTLIPEKWQSLIPPESWTLLTVGWAGNAGSYQAVLGSTLNLFPIAQNALSRAAKSTGADALAASIAYDPEAPLSLMGGIVASCKPMQSGVIVPFNRYDWAANWIVGPAWKF